ncbi:hypothetical protein OIO90_002247 [Microbotryomycetes sp. JL221]|nr:hypothetical protein OIO90_002247 [Microbotryomycetes sp. JL221]
MEQRYFKYLNERVRLEPKDLPPAFRTAKYLHFVCSPTRALVIQSQLATPHDEVSPTSTSALPDSAIKHSWDPCLVYEPIPDLCIPEELDSLRQVLPHIKVFSPNHEEAASFFGITVDQVKAQGRQGVEQVANRFFELGAQDMVVIRSGAWGAFTLRRGWNEGVWIEAFHKDVNKVKDVTGAGNSFLGGLMAGLVRDPEDLVQAVQMGSISASFTIEQFGLAKLSLDDEGHELWNGSSAGARLEDMKRRQ